MRLNDQLEEMQGYLDTECSESPEEVLERIRTLAVYMSRTGKMMADSKRILRRKMASEISQTIIAIAKEQFLSAKVQNAMLEAIADEEAYTFEWCERVNKSCTHQIDALRSVLSYEKEQLRSLAYGQ